MNGIFQARFGLLILLASSFLLSTACVKQTEIAKIPVKIQYAKTLSRTEMLQILGDHSAAIHSIRIPSLKARFIGGDVEFGKIEQYPSLPGYLLAQRPGFFRFVLREPVIKGTLGDLVSDGSEIRIWIPKWNKIFIGPQNLSRIDYQDVSQNPLANIRPQHLIPAILFETPEAGSSEIYIEEEKDESAKYYVIGMLERNAKGHLVLRRKIWLERFSLTIVRQKYFNRDGRPSAEIFYSRYMTFQDMPFSTHIELQRFDEHYSLILDLNRVEINPALSSDVFQLAEIPTAEIEILTESKIQ